jgi:hypothetical protein
LLLLLDGLMVGSIVCDGWWWRCRYDVTNPASFEGAKSWVRELQRRGDPHVVIALAANKVRRSRLLRCFVLVGCCCFVVNLALEQAA